MKVARSVEKVVQEWLAGDFESAMLHACNAVDGTAKKREVYAKLGNRARFCRFLRDEFEILGKFGMPGIDLERTLFPVSLQGKPAELLDLADILYKVHRCAHGHGDELEQGFELLPDVSGQPEVTTIVWDRDRVRLSDRMLFAMIAVAVVSKENRDQSVDEGLYLTFGRSQRMCINDWWGRRDDMLAVVRSVEIPSVFMDFSNVLPTANS